MEHLYTPITFKSITLKNRIAVSPMCQYSSDDGFANDWHLVHLGSRAVGGAALVICEATAVSPEGRITPFDLGIWKDEHIAYLSRINAFIAQQGAVPAIQLAHAGRKASHLQPWKGGTYLPPTEGGWQTCAPSAIPFAETSGVPQEMTTDDIKKVLNDFSQATLRALKAGFKIVEIHAAHGYLINSFLSPLSNSRTDDYGGSFENRCRFLMEVIASVKEHWPADLPIFVRISASDWVDGGWNIDDSVALARLLKQSGIDLVDCSSGGNSPDAVIDAKPGYQVQFAEAIKVQTGMPTGAVGIIVEAKQANDIIAEGKADIVLLAREMLREPYFALSAAQELGQDVSWPSQYERAKRSSR